MCEFPHWLNSHLRLCIYHVSDQELVNMYFIFLCTRELLVCCAYHGKHALDAEIDVDSSQLALDSESPNAGIYNA